MLDLTTSDELAEEGLNPLDDAHTAMHESAAGLEKGDAGESTKEPNPRPRKL